MKRFMFTNTNKDLLNVSKKLLLILFCLPFVSCFDNKEENMNEVTFKQVGYYKSLDKYRCFAYTYDKEDESQILAHAKKAIHTKGRTTAVYYFSKYNAKNISLCNSFNEAMELCLNLDWKYEFSIYPTGKEDFRKNQ